MAERRAFDALCCRSCLNASCLGPGGTGVWFVLLRTQGSSEPSFPPPTLLCNMLVTCLWFPTSSRSGCLSGIAGCDVKRSSPLLVWTKPWVLLFTSVRGRDGMVPKQTQTFSIPCAGRDEKVTGHGNSGFLYDSPPASPWRETRWDGTSSSN